MTQADSPTISFDVLLRGETDDVAAASVNLEKLRPSPETIETCFRWLSEQGVTCYRTGFGLACEATVELFESLFGVRVTQRHNGTAEQPTYEVHDHPRAPEEIRHLVSQVTVPEPPIFFT